jgi:hypothetical protein
MRVAPVAMLMSPLPSEPTAVPLATLTVPALIVVVPV